MTRERTRMKWSEGPWMHWKEDTLKRPLRHSSSVGSLNSLTDTGTTGNSSAPTLGKQARALTIASDFIRRIMPKCNEDGELINAPVGSTSTYTQDEGGSPAASNTVGAGTQSSKPTIKPILLVNDTQISASSAAKPSPLKPALSAVLPSTLKQASKVMSTTEVATAPATIALSASGVATVAPDTKDKNVSRQRLLIARPAEPVTCNCESHHEHETCNVILDLDVEAVYDAIFCKEGSEVVREAHRRRETEDVKFGEWAMDPATSNPTSRDLVYTISFKPPMFAKQVSQASERQVVMRYEPYAAYVVECNIKTPKVPYGECFTVYNRYCITHAGPGKTRVKITSKVDFNKRLMWKNQIEAATIDGMRGFCSELVSLIRKTGQRAKAGDLGSAAPDVSKSADGLSIQDAATANNTPLSGSPPNIHIEESSGMKSSLFSRLNAVAAHKFESLGSSSNHGSSLLWAVLVCLFILGFCLSALNVYWVMDIGRKLDRTAQEIARVKAGEASAVEDIFRVGTEKLLPKEEDIRYLRYVSVQTAGEFIS
ncbi:hypothetical protein DFS34DRAFT_166136 [Phlyctochytrium arcticum]|nr:hypothetical protein DFS34DRAFT_166136 [Phlyctochytrium arcticum]